MRQLKQAGYTAVTLANDQLGEWGVVKHHPDGYRLCMTWPRAADAPTCSHGQPWAAMAGVQAGQN